MTEVPSRAELAEVVDSILHMDDTDENGLIDYFEFVTAMRRNMAR